MDSVEFRRLVSMAQTNPELSRPEEYSPLYGLALHKDRRFVSEGGAIAFIRYQAMQFNGQWDQEELESLRYCFKRVDLLPLSRKELKAHFTSLAKILL